MTNFRGILGQSWNSEISAIMGATRLLLLARAILLHTDIHSIHIIRKKIENFILCCKDFTEFGTISIMIKKDSTTRHSILFPQLFYWFRIPFEIRCWRSRIWLSRTIYLNRERSEQCLKQNAFFNIPGVFSDLRHYI